MTKCTADQRTSNFMENIFSSLSSMKNNSVKVGCDTQDNGALS